MSFTHWASLLAYLATFVAGVDSDASVDPYDTRGSVHIVRSPTTIAGKTEKRSTERHLQVLQGGAFMALKAEVKRIDRQDASADTSSKANLATDDSAAALIAKKWLEVLFKALIADGSGQIRQEEWNKMMSDSGWREPMWQKLDNNKDKKISSGEFIHNWPRAVTEAYGNMGSAQEAILKWEANEQEHKLAKTLLMDQAKLDRNRFEEFIYSAAMYRALDTDLDGHLTWAECQAEISAYIAEDICQTAKKSEDKEMTILELWRVLRDRKQIFVEGADDSSSSSSSSSSSAKTKEDTSKKQEEHQQKGGGGSFFKYVVYFVVAVVLGGAGYYIYSITIGAPSSDGQINT